MFAQRSRKQRLLALIGNQRGRLYRIAWSWCRDCDLADDLVQETQARALAGLDDLRDETRAEVWLTRILVNLYRDSHRQRRSESELPDTLAGEDADPETLTERAEQVLRTRRAVAQLKEEHRQVLTLIDLGGFTYAETAEVLGTPVGTVMSRLSRARNRLRNLLAMAGNPTNVIPMRKKP